MNNTPTISIVVPIYGVERYLCKCLDTIVSQTYSHIDVVLIDDGSPDNCGAICDSYVQRDSRFRVFHIANGGVAKAREMGVENSRGEYIVFVDPDDWLPLDAVQVLYENMSEDIDIVSGTSANYRGDEIKSYTRCDALVLTQGEYIDLLMPWSISVGPGAKMFRRSLFGENSFPNIKRTQDLLMNLDLATRAHNIKVIDDVVYCYLSSATSTGIGFKRSFEYDKNLSLMMKQVLVRAGIFEQHKTSYAVGALNLLRKLMNSGAKVDASDPFVVEVCEILEGHSLKGKQAFALCALKSSFLRRLISALPVIRRVGKALKFKSK